jgi:hypothetical protein
MTKLAILALGLALAYTPAHSEQSDIKILTLEHDCAPAARVLPYLEEEFGERPFAFGRAAVNLRGGEEVQGVLLMNVNPSTRSYTINILFEDDDIVCMLTTGDKFQPASSKPKTSL